MPTDQEPSGTEPEPGEDGDDTPEGNELSIAQAAAKLGCSRVYVTMLCQKGMLREVDLTPTGHRRIQASAVDAYLATRPAAKDCAPTLQELAQAAGMYDVPEESGIGVVREAPTSH